ncbi:MAG: hypothetical protein OXF08_05965 [Bacteroidetes bacterium]|nr:hypothetical protein [Bacteroidota bacterium]
MAFDFTGLVNENEFYPDYYWHSRLPEKFKEFEKRVKSENVNWGSGNSTPPHFLNHKPLGWQYLSSKNQFSGASWLDRQEIQRSWTSRLLQILGYERAPHQIELDPHNSVSLLGKFKSFNEPYLWILEAVDYYDTGYEPLSLVSSSQGTKTFHKVVHEIFFGGADHVEAPPRWILVTGLETWILVERDKWGDQRMLRFNWDELYRQFPTIETWKLLTMLLHQYSLCPEDKPPFHEEIQEEALKHASGVSGSLKYALRESIELLGNEWVTSQRNKGYTWANIHRKAEDLTLECLYYMYRLLFLFNVEARPELGYLPMDAVAYRNGYSLEKLRELEMISLDENGSADGTFFHDSIMMLFKMVYEGHDEGLSQTDIYKSGIHTFEISPLKCDLFDPEKTPLLNTVKIPNRTWQKIVQMMSLEHEEFRKEKNKKKRGGRGRISYRHLTVNHLGAVYEALLSYNGFIAKEDLYEVKKAGESPDILDPAYFVNEESLNEYYNMDERVFNKDGTLKKYPNGSFIYRLTGRAREESASYYTPESLTQLITEFTLKEVLEGKSADEILELTVCEPAMGSAAFLNEAITQLAEAYMMRKTKELGEMLDPDRYKKELQRVKMHLADNNVYGVDLNPTAVKLGEISIWLNTLVSGGFVPWFGNQLKCGNSLVGAWSRVYTKRQVANKKWWETAPVDVPLYRSRPDDAIYHFLLGDAGMANYRGNKGKVIKSLAEDEINHINEWRKSFIKPHDEGEIQQLLHISSIIDTLWEEHVSDLLRLEKLTTDPFDVYPKYDDRNQNTVDIPSRATTREKEERFNQILNPDDQNTSAYQRLKLVMDYWCALWYWPIHEASHLPNRAEFLSDLMAILSGKEDAISHDMFADTPERDTLGFIDLNSLTLNRPRLQIVKKLSAKYHFHHWQLEYADIFKTRGGFDIVLGNPPWQKPDWVEKNVIANTEPRFVTQKLSATRTKELRNNWLVNSSYKQYYIQEYESISGKLSFLNVPQNFPLLEGMQTNLYKPFICISWAISRKNDLGHYGAIGLLHPDSVYDEPYGQILRESLYPRLRWRLQFINKLELFEDVGSDKRFSINIYGYPRETIDFKSMANLYSPITVIKSIQHDGLGSVPGIKSYDNKWELSGHSDRLIQTTEADLRIFAHLYSGSAAPPRSANLPLLHARQLSNTLHKLANCPTRIHNLDYKFTSMWHETNAQKDGTILRRTCFPENPSEWILSGPHIFVANPFSQTPNDGCTSKFDYSRIDLTRLPESYLPRTNYVRASTELEYLSLTPRTPWGTLVTDEFRVVFRAMLNIGQERSLIPALLPPSPGHSHALVTVGARNSIDLFNILTNVISIVIDMIIKISGKGYLNPVLLTPLPISPLPKSALARSLGLSCITLDYQKIWDELTLTSNFSGKNRTVNWSKNDHRLNQDWFGQLNQSWSSRSPLRTDYERRQALLEIDVLHAQSLKLTLNELLTIYRIQFPTLQSNEKNTWYDTKGRIVFSKKTGQSPIPKTKKNEKSTFGIHTPSRSQTNIPLGWNDIKDLKEGVVTYTFMDDTMPGGPRERTIEFHAPFDKCDREEDYRQAWAFFEEAKANGTLI